MNPNSYQTGYLQKRASRPNRNASAVIAKLQGILDGRLIKHRKQDMNPHELWLDWADLLGEKGSDAVRAFVGKLGDVRHNINKRRHPFNKYTSGFSTVRYPTYDYNAPHSFKARKLAALSGLLQDNPELASSGKLLLPKKLPKYVQRSSSE